MNSLLIAKLTLEWKACDDKIVVLKRAVRIASGDIKRLKAQIESVQTQIAMLQEINSD